MATQAEKIELAVVSGLLGGAVKILGQQAPAIRDAQIRRQIEGVMNVVAGAGARVDGILDE